MSLIRNTTKRYPLNEFIDLLCTLYNSNKYNKRTALNNILGSRLLPATNNATGSTYFCGHQKIIVFEVFYDDNVYTVCV